MQIGLEKSQIVVRSSDFGGVILNLEVVRIAGQLQGCAQADRPGMLGLFTRTSTHQVSGHILFVLVIIQRHIVLYCGITVWF